MGECASLLEKQHGFQHKFITTRNPQGNSMIERANKTVGNLIRMIDFPYPLSDDDLSDDDRIEGAIAQIGFAMRSAVHSTRTGATHQKNIIYPLGAQRTLIKR